MKELKLNKELIADMYRAANPSQLEVLLDVLDLKTQIITDRGLRSLYKIACGDWKARLKREFPSVFPDTGFAFDNFDNFDAFDEVNEDFMSIMERCGLTRSSIQILHGAATKDEYQNKGLYISSKYDLEINKGSSGYFEIIFRHGNGKLLVSGEVSLLSQDGEITTWYGDSKRDVNEVPELPY